MKKKINRYQRYLFVTTALFQVPLIQRTNTYEDGSVKVEIGYV